jgi:sec-independent protein translocase protein TatA
MLTQVGPLEVVLVAAIALLVLGPKRLPGAAKSLGKGIREFRESVSNAVPSSEELDMLGTQVEQDEKARKAK